MLVIPRADVGLLTPTLKPLQVITKDVTGPNVGRAGLRLGRPTSLKAIRPAPLPVHLLYAANRFLPIKGRAFIDLVAPMLKGVFAGPQPPRREMCALAQRTARSMATSIRLAEHEIEGHNEELIAVVIADMQDPVMPILKAALAR